MNMCTVLLISCEFPVKVNKKRQNYKSVAYQICPLIFFRARYPKRYRVSSSFGPFYMFLG